MALFSENGEFIYIIRISLLNVRLALMQTRNIAKYMTVMDALC
jgi:hypothetical protein